MAITGTELMAIQAGASLLSGIFGGKRRRRAQREAKAARDEMRAKYEALDTSNLYADMENPYEDLTVNLQQAEFMREQQQQQQANLLSGLQQAAGGSGIGGLAQAVAGQGIVASQQAAASIGQQEAANKRLAAQGAGVVQQMKAQGAAKARQLEADKTATLFGIESQRLAEANRARAQARQAIAGGIGSLAMMGIGGQFKGMFGGGNNFNLANATMSGTPLNLTNQAYMNPVIGPSSLPYQSQQFNMLSPFNTFSTQNTYGNFNLESIYKQAGLGPRE
jgi:hypothetical protein